MITSQQIRQQYMDFFANKGHKIVPSAPMVVKGDPTLMFTNAGMNQFKDIFLGNRAPEVPRIANTQKCLRVSGKHNDLEEVGHDTYHHTMFEMLGNWSFGDYFKEDAIQWAWELLHDVFGMDRNRLYATVFEGDATDNLEPDQEAKALWSSLMDADHILYGSKKDNFWEMGESGPCGPCSEVHIDLRDETERNKIPGRDLVNTGHPLVVEIWNLVFIQYNRMSDGSLVPLPNKHVDTGMGFERLCMALQGKKSNYDTDVFQPVIQTLGELSGHSYGVEERTDVAFRVIADHLRAVSFSIADGQLPSNVKAGYVIRRILRRAIRYGYTYLGFREPFIHLLVPVLAKQMGSSFPELPAQQQFIMKVIAQEEGSFLRTLETGIHLLDQMIDGMKLKHEQRLDGRTAFLLYDTYGFPADLTALILAEQGLAMDYDGFQAELEAQKSRSRDAARQETDDWVILEETMLDDPFIGYDQSEAEVTLLRYRKVTLRDKVRYQLVFDRTPFYAESGGQVGDTGILKDLTSGEEIEILTTVPENQLILHITERIPTDPHSHFLARVDASKRAATARNHTATHLLHKALRDVLGTHVEQKGSLVHPDYFRFDFSHFGKMSEEELTRVESMVNDHILSSVHRDEQRSLPLEAARDLGAMMLFGEKYGETVRVIRFGESVELCGGIHVEETGEIGVFKILSEGAIAAGIRRIEAITGHTARKYYEEQLQTVDRFKELLRSPKDPVKALEQLLTKHKELEDQLAAFSKAQAADTANRWLETADNINGIRFIAAETSLATSDIKDIAFRFKEHQQNLVMVLTGQNDGKANIAVFISTDLIKSKGFHAGNFIKQVAPLIQGGGGGQDFFATAGGKIVDGLKDAVAMIRNVVSEA